jgi:hypothetical protein
MKEGYNGSVILALINQNCTKEAHMCHLAASQCPR